ncbi:MAG TPA: hypothetical protein VM802_28365 [Chitinophaga sp.]|uniref:hypothetical protein n=1 Tax=Chitinophaga sp. TaxID=1869181 RepID=UPI002CE282FC|nr:hypothetical protein [Chitinophaga sp.]HVI48817.1 hypothetical protein [Chitinophaga sp.]
MENAIQAKQEVIRFVEEIEKWFNGANTSVEILMQNFSTSFRMTSPDGKKINYEDLLHWLPSVKATKPGVRITLTALEGYATAEHALVSYIETQESPTGKTIRESSAVFVREEGRFVWYLLEEEWKESI